MLKLGIALALVSSQSGAQESLCGPYEESSLERRICDCSEMQAGDIEKFACYQREGAVLTAISRLKAAQVRRIAQTPEGFQAIRDILAEIDGG